jgi:probable phosphoglycerate mutase
MPVTHIHIIRHGETTWNASKRWQGQIDTALSERGQQQARLLAAYLRGRAITAIYSSDLMRARATAEPLAAALGLRVRTDARLREMALGVLQGLTIDEIRAQYQHELDALKANWLDHRVPGGESRRMMQMRAHELLEEVDAREAGPEIALVTHGGVVRVLMQRLFPDHPDVTTKPVENTSITTIVRGDGAWHVERLFETPHLAPHVPDRGETEAQ